MDSSLKQRLLGAVVLIALAIIFVPMFLSSSPPKSPTETVTLPVPPERSFETRVLPVTDNPNPPLPASKPPAVPAAASDQVVTVDTHAPPKVDVRPEDSLPHPPSTGSSSSAPDGKTSVATNSTPAAEKVVPEKSAPPVEKNPEKPAPIAQPVANSTGGKFALNLGIYANHDHVVALIANMKKLGLTAYTESTEHQGKPAERVRIGPFADRATAEAARLKIKQADAKIPTSVSESTDQPAPPVAVPEAAPKRAGGWAVQLGAFKSEDEANKLRDKARNNGFSTFVDKVGNGAQVLWRVRVGPEVERTNADKLRATLKQKIQIDGMVVAQP